MKKVSGVDNPAIIPGASDGNKRFMLSERSGEVIARPRVSIPYTGPTRILASPRRPQITRKANRGKDAAKISSAPVENKPKERSLLMGALQTLGDAVADENPILRPDGTRDYHAAEVIEEQRAKVREDIISGAANAVGDGVSACRNFAEEHPNIAGGIEAAAELALCTATKIPKAVKAVTKALDAIVTPTGDSGAGGLTLITPTGHTVVGALESAPAAVTVGSAAIGVAAGEAAAGGIVSLSFDSKSNGGGKSSGPAGSGGPERSERKVDTPEIRNAYWNKLKKSDKWERVSGYGKPTLRNKKNGQFVQKSMEKWELEVFSKDGKHEGVIKPSEGKLRPEFKVKDRNIEK
jgi:hypothetical protein